MDISVKQIEALNKNSSAMLKNLLIEARLKNIKKPLVDNLCSTFENNNGNVEIMFDIYDEIENRHINLKSNNRIMLSNSLLRKLEELADSSQIEFAVNNRRYVPLHEQLEEDEEATQEEIVEDLN